jgi:uncharacterized protein
VSRLRPLAAAATAAAAIAATMVVAPGAEATVSTNVVINEVYGGGGNSGATLKNDFIELYNGGTTAVALSSWSVQYLSAAPTQTSTWQVTDLTGSIAPGGYFLIQEAAGAGGTQSLPAPDSTGSINMSGTSGTVALDTTQTALTCLTAAACAADPTVHDLVGYGTAVVHEGTADAPITSNTTSDSRTNGVDTDQNGADFTNGAPSPTDSGTSGGTPPPTAGPLRIHDIQSDDWISPENGQTVTNVPGIVTAIRTSGSEGYWIQDPAPDNDPATSEGIFVYTGSAPAVSVGDSVLVTGKVEQYYPLASGDTDATTSNLSVTEIESPTAITLSSGNPLPAPIVLTPGLVPSTYAPDLGGASIEAGAIVPTRSALDFYESIEGMRVEIDNAPVIGPSDTYGEQYVTSDPGVDSTFRGGSELLGENLTPAGRIEVVADDGSNPEVSVGDEFSGATVGTVDYSQYGGFTIAASTLGTVVHNNLAPTVATPATAKQLSIATYNVENLAPSDPASKYQALAQGIVQNLASPDIIAVEEVQDNSGATDDGTVAANVTISDLTTAIVAAGGPQYSYREIDPANDQDGGEPGGNIRQVFLYNQNLVTFVDRGSDTVDRTTTGTAVIKNSGEPDLTLSPGRIDPDNPVWQDSRKPLVGEFEFRGSAVFVIANHFTAKLGDQNQDGRYQYPQQSSEIQRSGQAQVEHDFVQSILNIDKKADVVVVGDLNDYQFSPALASLETGSSDGTGPSILKDLITTLPVNQQYTYVYEGVSEVLDHILVSEGVGSYTYQVVHINSEYANQTSDHDPQEVELKP